MSAWVLPSCSLTILLVDIWWRVRCITSYFWLCLPVLNFCYFKWSQVRYNVLFCQSWNLRSVPLGSNNPRTHSHASVNGQREEENKAFSCQTSIGLNIYFPRIFDQTNSDVADKSRYELHKIIQDLEEVILCNFYHFTLTFIGFTTFHLEKFSLSLQKRMK